MHHPEIDHPKKWKYAQPDFERRFLLKQDHTILKDASYKDIHDKYLSDTNLRLRKSIQDNIVQYKLTKKLRLDEEGKSSHWISTIYLNESEFNIFWSLAGIEIIKRRFYAKGKMGEAIGLDEIKLINECIWIAEVEFDNKTDMQQYQFPFPYEEEVTNKPLYTGFELSKRFRK